MHFEDLFSHKYATGLVYWQQVPAPFDYNQEGANLNRAFIISAGFQNSIYNQL